MSKTTDARIKWYEHQNDWGDWYTAPHSASHTASLQASSPAQERDLGRFAPSLSLASLRHGTLQSKALASAPLTREDNASLHHKSCTKISASAQLNRNTCVLPGSQLTLPLREA